MNRLLIFLPIFLVMDSKEGFRRNHKSGGTSQKPVPPEMDLKPIWLPLFYASSPSGDSTLSSGKLSLLPVTSPFGPRFFHWAAL